VRFALFGAWYFGLGAALLPGPTLLITHLGLNVYTRRAYRRQRWEALLGAIVG